MDINRAVALIESAMQSPGDRTVILSSQSTAAGRPSINTLHILLNQLIDQSGFSGLVDLYFLDLQTQENIHFAYQTGQDISINPDIAFSANSTIKIPIMLSVFLHFNSKISPEIDTQLKGMIAHSSNAEADSLMAILRPCPRPAGRHRNHAKTWIEKHLHRHVLCTWFHSVAALCHSSKFPGGY